MDKKYRIGIAMATYNGSQFVKEQLQSILNQTVKPDILIISDGGSSDGTADICDEFLKDTDIQYRIYTSNTPLNVRENFQKALSYCDADFIFFADQDDYWKENKIKSMMDIFQIKGVKLVYANALLVDQSLNSLNKSLWDTVGYSQRSKLKVYKKDSKSYLSILLQHQVITGMSMAITSDLKNAVIPFSQYGIHDDWIAIVSNCIGKVAALNEQLVLYRQHSQNTIGASDSILKAFQRRTEYLGSVLNRLKFVKAVLRFTKNNNGSNVELIQDYLSHIEFRINFIKHKYNLFSLLSKIKNYRKYEYGYKMVILKDLYTHIFSP